VYRGEGVELDAPEGRHDVRVGHVLVRLVGTLTHRASHRVLEPPLDVLADRQAPVLEDELAVPDRHRLRKLLACLLSGLAGDVAALGTGGRVYRVGATVANPFPVLLVRIDRALAIAVLRHA
jgi:hypothetical protein